MSGQRASLVIRSLWALCMLGAGFNHARTLLRHGLWWDYGGVGWPSAAYWTSLTFFRPKAGVALTVAIIASNVAHNLAIVAHRAPGGEFLNHVASSPFVLSQIAFLLFVLATAGAACIGTKARGAAFLPEEPPSASAEI
jgi:hypothetical protein